MVNKLLKNDLSIPKRPAPILVSPLKPFVTGINLDISKQSELMETLNRDIDDMTLILSKTPFRNPLKKTQPSPLKKPKTKLKKLRFKGSVIAVSVADTKKTTSKDKLNLCKKSFPNTRFIRTLLRGSILKDPHFSNLSKKSLADMSMKLWLPIKIAYAGSLLNSSNGYVTNMESHSWFSITRISRPPNKNSLKTCSLSCTFSPAVSMGSVNTQKRKTIAKTKKSVKVLAKYDPTKRPCCFPYVKKINNMSYVQYCNDPVIDGVYCQNHIGKPQPNGELIIGRYCEHIINQTSRGKDRKGMYCGNLITDNNDYCKSHLNQHNSNIDPTKEYVMRSFKVRFYPSTIQRQKLKKYFGCARYTYNKCVENEVDSERGFIDIRNEYVTKLIHKYEFLKDCPKEIRAFAVKEYVTATNNSKAMYEYCKEHGKKYREPVNKFRKKSDKQSITINKNGVKNRNKNIYIYTNIFDDEPLKLRNKALKKDRKLKEVLEKPIYHDIKILKSNTNKYYISIPYKVEAKRRKLENSKIDVNKVCSIDPGIRTFLTAYNNNEITEIGENIGDQMYDMLDKLKIRKGEYVRAILKDKLKTTMETKREKQKKRHIYRLLQEKIYNKVTDLHCKAITKLMNYDLILVPKLRVANMKTLHGIVKSAGIRMRHVTFVNRFLQKAEVTGKVVSVISEHLTTKICSVCFERTEVKDSKIYKCQNCGEIMDRDYNASKNILLKHLEKLE